MTVPNPDPSPEPDEGNQDDLVTVHFVEKGPSDPITGPDPVLKKYFEDHREEIQEFVAWAKRQEELRKARGKAQRPSNDADDVQMLGDD